MGQYSQYIYVRTVNPGTDAEYAIFGSSPEDVSDTVVTDNETMNPVVARYVLAGVGEIHYSAPMYVEHA